MATNPPVKVSVRELKNRLTSYLRLAKTGREVIVTERGRPIAVIKALPEALLNRNLETRIAMLAARGEIEAPEAPLAPRIRRAKVRGTPLSRQILEDRR